MNGWPKIGGSTRHDTVSDQHLRLSRTATNGVLEDISLATVFACRVFVRPKFGHELNGNTHGSALG